MAWTPTINILKSRAIAENILAFIATNQADAILWANGSPIRTIAQFSDSVANRTAPIYPSIAIESTEDGQVFGNDIHEAAFVVTFEVIVESASPTTAVSEAKVYDTALKSMIANIPASTIAANTGAIIGTIVLEDIESGFEDIKSNDMENDFFQPLKIKASFTLKM